MNCGSQRWIARHALLADEALFCAADTYARGSVTGFYRSGWQLVWQSDSASVSGTLTDSCLDSKESFSIGLWFFQCSIYKGDSGEIFPGVSRVNKETKTSCFLVTQRHSDKGDSAGFFLGDSVKARSTSWHLRRRALDLFSTLRSWMAPTSLSGSHRLWTSWCRRNRSNQ